MAGDRAEVVVVDIVASQDLSIASRQESAVLAFDGPADQLGSTGRSAGGDLVVDEPDEFVGESYGDLRGHALTVPIWDSICNQFRRCRAAHRAVMPTLQKSGAP